MPPLCDKRHNKQTIRLNIMPRIGVLPRFGLVIPKVGFPVILVSVIFSDIQGSDPRQ